MLGDLARDELRIVLDPADQRRAARVLPCQPEEVEAGRVGDTSAVTRTSILIENRHVDPRVVRAVAGRPDHRIGTDRAAVFKAEGASHGLDGARLQLDAGASQLAWARPDQCVARAQLSTEARLDR